MATPKFVLLPPEQLILPGDFSEFNAKSRIDPPIKSSYLAIITALFQSLIRIKDSSLSSPSWASLDSYIKQTDEFVMQIPDSIPLWEKFKFMVNEIFKKRDKLTALRNIRQMLEINHQSACDALDIGARLLLCVIVDKDHQYNDILASPYVLRGKEYYLQHLCNKLRVNVLIVMATSHQYIVRDDKNNSPLVTLFMEGDGYFSVLYHRESLQVDLGTPMTDGLDKFPFFYNPKAATKPVNPSTPAPVKVPEAQPVKEQQKSPVISTETRKSEPNSPLKDNIYKQIIFQMSTMIFTNLPNHYDDLLLELLNDGAAFDPSLDDKDYARLKANLNRLKPAEPAQMGPPRQQCGHPQVLYKHCCGNDHCAYCLKELFDQGRLKCTAAACEHGGKISPKVGKELENLLKSGQQGENSPGIPRGGIIPPPAQKTQISPQGNYQAAQQINNPNIVPIQSKAPAYTPPNDPHMDGEVSIPVAIKRPGANPNIQPGYQVQNGPSNLPQNYPQQSGMRYPTNQSQFGANPAMQSRTPAFASNPPSYPQPPNQQRGAMPAPYQGVPQAPPLVSPVNAGNPQGGLRSAPSQAGIECYQCESIKPSDDFSIACPDHKTCNVCRIHDFTKCINCGRSYAESDVQILSAIRNSFT